MAPKKQQPEGEEAQDATNKKQKTNDDVEPRRSARQAQKGESAGKKESKPTSAKKSSNGKAGNEKTESSSKKEDKSTGKKDEKSAGKEDSKSTPQTPQDSKSTAKVSNSKSSSKSAKDTSSKSNSIPSTHGSKHDSTANPEGTTQASNSNLPSKGAIVHWKAMPGWVKGEVVEVLRESRTIEGGKNVKASSEEPRIVLKSHGPSGKIAVHKPEAVWF